MESYSSLDNAGSLNAQIFASHFGHLAVISGLAAAEFFHVGWNGNFSCVLKNPIATLGIAHTIGDPHFGSSLGEAFSAGGSYYGSLECFTGVYNWLYALHFSSVFDIYNLVIACELLAVVLLSLGNLHWLSHTFAWHLCHRKPKVFVPGRGTGVSSSGSWGDTKVYPIFIGLISSS